jgi:iron complex outermembrane receptor protein
MQSTRQLKCVLSAGAAVAALGVGTVAFAQQAPAAADGGAVAEVVVTAQKRSERLLDVPMSISAASGEQLKAAGISSTGDLQQVTPGLVTVNNGLAFTPAIRGVSSIGTSPGDETNVAVYLDDVYLGAPLANLFDLKDIERVEVLKGPQGTLFGRNATGGAIRVVTRAPSFSPHAELSADYGFDFNQTKLGAYLTGPITDKLAGSVDLYYLHNRGYMSGVGPINDGNRYAKSNNAAIRGKLLFKPTDNYRATLAADLAERNDNSVFSLAPVDGQNVNRSNPAAVLPAPFQYAGSVQPIIKVQTRGVSLDQLWEPSKEVSVRSITAWRRARGTYQSDVDRLNLANGGLRLQQNQDTFSQEINLTGPSDRTLTWLAGAYFYHSDAGNPYFKSFGTDAPNGPVTASFTNRVRSTSVAGFGELNYNPITDLHITLGARYTSETKHLYFADTFRAAGLRTANAEATWTSPTYRAVVRYDLTSQANVYVSASNGFKSGVFNAYALPAIPVQPEKIKAYEVGAKARLHGITLTAAAFDYEYQNIQVQGQTSVNNVWVVTLSNAARAKIRGFELTAEGNVTDHLSMNVGVSSLPTARYSSFTQAQVFIPNPATGGATNVVPYDASGSRVIRSPKWQANVSATYTDRLFDGDFAGTLAYSYNSGFFWQPANLSHEQAYSLLNGKLAWTEPTGRITYSLWGENLTNETYSMYTTSGAVGISAAYAMPRLIGVGVDAKF